MATPEIPDDFVTEPVQTLFTPTQSKKSRYKNKALSQQPISDPLSNHKTLSPPSQIEQSTVVDSKQGDHLSSIYKAPIATASAKGDYNTSTKSSNSKFVKPPKAVSNRVQKVANLKKMVSKINIHPPTNSYGNSLSPIHTPKSMKSQKSSNSLLNKSIRSDGSYFTNGTLIPLSKAPKICVKLFRQFDRSPDQSLDGIELIKFQKYINRLFEAPSLKNQKPPSIFDAVQMDSNGVNYTQFQQWVIENLTYDDSDELGEIEEPVLSSSILIEETVEEKVEEPPVVVSNFLVLTNLGNCEGCGNSRNYNYCDRKSKGT